MSLDLQFNLFLQNSLRNPFLDKLFVFITNLGDGGFFWILMCLILTIIKKTRFIGITCFIALAFNLTIVEIIKFLVNRTRPYQDYFIQILIAEPAGTSFPSGHTSSSFAVATAYFLLGKSRPNSIIRWFTLLLAFLIGFSRLYLFVHYPSDVIVGALIGVVVAFITVKVMTKFRDEGKLEFLKISK